MAKSQKRKTIHNSPAAPRDKLLSKLTIWFFDKPRTTAILWLLVTVFGLFSYTTFLTREGFPSVNIPIAIVGGTYFVNDPAKVDSDVAKPISDAALAIEGVSTVQATSTDNFFTIQILYEEGVDAKAVTSQLQQTVKDSGELPAQAVVQYNVPYFGVTGGDVQKLDEAISFYDTTGQASIAEITQKAESAAQKLKDKQLPQVQEVFVKSPFETVTDPATGQTVNVQQNFDRFGIRENDQTNHYNSVIIGVSGIDGADVITLNEQVEQAIHEIGAEEEFAGFAMAVSASFAPNIEENIGELQRVLIEGLIAVLIVGSIVIAIRASLITVASMITVLLASLGLLFVFGYTLNVITLFALILSLALIVDDTIIMVEAIDAARHRHKDKRKAVSEATRKVSRAMVAATLTAALSFAPLLFVGGILGSFISAIPITIISALLISLVVALVFIPFFARFVLLTPKHMGKKAADKEVAAGFEAALARFITAPMLWARHSKRKLVGVGSTAIVIGLAFIVGGLFIAQNVVFNIFPPTKDTNALSIAMTFPPDTTIAKATEIAGRADALAAETLGENFKQGSYFNSGTNQSAVQQITIISYNERKETSPQLVEQLQERFNNEFKDARVVVGQVDLGPPTASFVVHIKADDREAAFEAANDLAGHLETAKLERPNGTTASFVNVAVSGEGEFIRDEGQAVVAVRAGFDASDTTTLVNLAQDEVNSVLDEAKLASYGLPSDAITFELGQEAENQESFQTLIIAFPALLLVMYLLLAVQFRSLLQPLLIFMAIPFSIFGIMLGLDITNNAISFFALLGFFALVGLSIKNTILLTDFANQARRSGLSAIDSAVAALRERFRPLFATSVTAVVSLIPLALTSPFWQGLAVVLIFGLISSTFLVVTVFPYYYLGAEYLRVHISGRQFALWALPTLAAVIIVSRFTNPGVGLLVIPASLLLVGFKRYFHRRLNT